MLSKKVGCVMDEEEEGCVVDEVGYMVDGKLLSGKEGEGRNREETK